MAKSPENPDDGTTAVVCAAVLGATFAVAALPIAGGRAAASVAIGAAIAVANLVTMRAIVRALIQPPPDAPVGDGDASTNADPAVAAPETRDHKAEGRRGGLAWGGFALVKIFVLFGGIYLLLTRGLVDPIPLVVGYGVLPLGIAAGAFVSGLRPRR